MNIILSLVLLPISNISPDSTIIESPSKIVKLCFLNEKEISSENVALTIISPRAFDTFSIILLLWCKFTFDVGFLLS